jgi:hypothetical protein
MTQRNGQVSVIHSSSFRSLPINAQIRHLGRGIQIFIVSIALLHMQVNYALHMYTKWYALTRQDDSSYPDSHHHQNPPSTSLKSLNKPRSVPASTCLTPDPRLCTVLAT